LAGKKDHDDLTDQNYSTRPLLHSTPDLQGHLGLTTDREDGEELSKLGQDKLGADEECLSGREIKRPSGVDLLTSLKIERCCLFHISPGINALSSFEWSLLPPFWTGQLQLTIRTTPSAPELSMTLENYGKDIRKTHILWSTTAPAVQWLTPHLCDSGRAISSVSSQ